MSQSTAVAPAVSLEERITRRIHDSLGDLVTDDDLKAMVARGIEHALFQPRVTQGTGWNSQTTKPSIVDQAVETLLAAKMATAVDQWFLDNPERVEKAVADAIQKGAGAAFLSYLDSKFVGIFQSGVEHMRMQGILPR